MKRLTHFDIAGEFQTVFFCCFDKMKKISKKSKGAIFVIFNSVGDLNSFGPDFFGGGVPNIFSTRTQKPCFLKFEIK